MTKSSPKTVWILIGSCLLLLALPALRVMGQTTEQSADLSQRVEELQKQVEALRAEMAKLKEERPPASSAATTTPAPPASAVAPETPAASSVTATSAQPAASTSGNPISTLLANTTITGFVDTYYGYNFNQPHNRTSGLRAFDGPSNQFSLNMIELIFDKAPDAAGSRLGYHLAFGYGNAMNVVNATDPGGLGFAQYLKEGYLSYLAPVGKGLQIDAGKFVTPHGQEVIESKDNWNYSRGLLFTWAIPFYHFGLRAKYTFSDKFAMTGYLVNGWNSIVDNNTGKTGGVTLAWTPSKKVSIIENYMAGAEMPNTNSHPRQLSDTVVTISPTSKLSFALNYDYGRGDQPIGFVKPVFWTGAAGYVHYAFTDSVAWTTRYEYFDDHDGFMTGTAPGHIQEITNTFEKRVHKNLITRFEYRYDNASNPLFLKGALPVAGQNTVAVGLIYMFDWKEQ